MNAATDEIKQACVAKLAVRRAKSALEPAENIRGKAEINAKLKADETLRLKGLIEQHAEWFATLTSKSYTGDRLSSFCCALGRNVSGTKAAKAGEILLAGATTVELLNEMTVTTTATSLLTKRASKVADASEQKKRKVTASLATSVATSAATAAASTNAIAPTLALTLPVPAATTAASKSAPHNPS